MGLPGEKPGVLLAERMHGLCLSPQHFYQYQYRYWYWYYRYWYWYCTRSFFQCHSFIQIFLNSFAFGLW